MILLKRNYFLLLLVHFFFISGYSQNMYFNVNDEAQVESKDQLICGYFLNESDTIFLVKEKNENEIRFKNEFYKRSDGRLSERSLGSVLSDKFIDKINSALKEDSNQLSHPVLIKLWFTACKPCINSMDEFISFDNAQNRVKILGLTFDSEERISQFLNEKNWNFPNITSEKGLMNNFSPLIMPKYVLIDSNYRVVYISTSIPTRSVLEKLL